MKRNPKYYDENGKYKKVEKKLSGGLRPMRPIRSAYGSRNWGRDYVTYWALHKPPSGERQVGVLGEPGMGFYKHNGKTIFHINTRSLTCI